MVLEMYGKFLFIVRVIDKIDCKWKVMLKIVFYIGLSFCFLKKWFFFINGSCMIVYWNLFVINCGIILFCIGVNNDIIIYMRSLLWN